MQNKEETLSEMLLHDVGFVNGSDLVSSLFGGVVKGELGDAPRLVSGDDL